MLLQGHVTAAWLWLVVYSQAHVSTVAPDYIEPSFLWSPSSSLALYIPFQCQLWIAILSHSAHVAISIEVVVAESDCGYLGSASICRRCRRF